MSVHWTSKETTTRPLPTRSSGAAVFARSMNSASDSPDKLSSREPNLLDEIAAEQAKVIAAEIAQLESRAAQLQAEIAELAGDNEERIA